MGIMVEAFAWKIKLNYQNDNNNLVSVTEKDGDRYTSSSKASASEELQQLWELYPTKERYDDSRKTGKQYFRGKLLHAESLEHAEDNDNTFFDFEFEGSLASCSTASIYFGISNGKEFESFIVNSPKSDKRMVQLGVKNPVSFREALKYEIRVRAAVSPTTLEYSRFFAPEIWE